FYRIPIYNRLNKILRERGYNLIIWSTEIDKQNEKLEFDLIEDRKMDLFNFWHILKKQKITMVINFLQWSDPGYFFYFFSVFTTKITGRKNIFYGHGMNLKYRNHRGAKILYNCLYFLFDKVILYTPNERKLFWKIHQT